MAWSDASIPEVIQQGGLVLSYAYIAFKLYSDNKAKDKKLEELNSKVLEAFIGQTKTNEQMAHALDNNTRAVEKLTILVETKVK